MNQIRLKINLTQRSDTVRPQIKSMVRAFGLQGRRRALTMSGQDVVRMTRSNFGSSGRFRGNKWPPYSRAYSKKVGSRIPTLFRSGKLRDSIKLGAPRGNWIEISTNVKYAAAQMLGNPRQNLPSRNFFPMERMGANRWRPVYSAEREMIVSITKSFRLISGGVIPQINTIQSRSVPTFGNIFQPPTGA